MTEKTVRSVDRALRVLLCVASAESPTGLTDISTEAEIDKATALRLLNTLELFRLVKRDASSRKYSIGTGIWQALKSYQSDLKSVAEPHLRALRDLTGESVSLVVESGIERVVLMAIEATQELRVVPTLNSVVPIYAGASGKVLMAFMPEAQRTRIIESTGLKPINDRTLIDRKSFLQSLDKVREDGYATSISDVTLGATAIAAPVLDELRAVHAVVSLRGPETRMGAERLAALAPLVMESAQRISQELFGAESQTPEADMTTKEPDPCQVSQIQL